MSYGTAHNWCQSLIINSDNESTITNARGQERPATYAPREQPALDAVLDKVDGSTRACTCEADHQVAAR